MECITEDGLVEIVRKNKGILHTRKYSNINIVDLSKCPENTLVCLTGNSQLIMQFFTNIINRFRHKIILIFVETDGCKIDNIYLEHKLVKHIFTWNKPINHPKLTCLPIGLNQDRQGDVLQRFVKNNKDMIENVKDRKWLYFNCSLNTNNKRSELEQLVNNKWKDFCDIIENVPFQKTYFQKSNIEGQIKIQVTDSKCYENMVKYKFILSPFGAGYDCHRTWEALYLNCIPIVQTSPIDEIFDELPVVIVKSWEDINLDFLKIKYEEIMRGRENNEYNLRKIYLKYWIDKITSYE
jgi:hypothetical protein